MCLPSNETLPSLPSLSSFRSNEKRKRWKEGKEFKSVFTDKRRKPLPGCAFPAQNRTAPTSMPFLQLGKFGKSDACSSSLQWGVVPSIPRVPSVNSSRTLFPKSHWLQRQSFWMVFLGTMEIKALVIGDVDKNGSACLPGVCCTWGWRNNRPAPSTNTYKDE